MKPTRNTPHAGIQRMSGGDHCKDQRNIVDISAAVQKCCRTECDQPVNSKHKRSEFRVFFRTLEWIIRLNIYYNIEDIILRYIRDLVLMELKEEEMKLIYKIVKSSEHFLLRTKNQNGK